MPKCHICEAEYSNKSSFCVSCGADLRIEDQSNLFINDKTTHTLPNGGGNQYPGIPNYNAIIWKPPQQFYDKYSKLYGFSSKQLEIAKKYNIINDPTEINIAYGTVYSSLDSILIYIKNDEVVISKINLKKQDQNKIFRFARGATDLANTYNYNKHRFDTERLLGFKVTKALESGSISKQYITYFEMLQIVLPDKAKDYFISKFGIKVNTSEGVDISTNGSSFDEYSLENSQNGSDWKKQMDALKQKGNPDSKSNTDNESTIRKVCLNCGDVMFAKARRCPTCAEKGANLYEIDINDKEKLQEIIRCVPNPKNTINAKWKQNIEIQQSIMKNSSKYKKQVIEERKIKADEQGIACCPKCGSVSLSANKKGFGIGKAIIGRTIIGDIGLTAGNIGAKKLIVTCLKCGYQFMPGK